MKTKTNYINLTYKTEFSTPFENREAWLDKRELMNEINSVVSESTLQKLWINGQLGKWTKFRRKLYLLKKDTEIAKLAVTKKINKE